MQEDSPLLFTKQHWGVITAWGTNLKLTFFRKSFKKKKKKALSIFNKESHSWHWSQSSWWCQLVCTFVTCQDQVLYGFAPLWTTLSAENSNGKCCPGLKALAEQGGRGGAGSFCLPVGWTESAVDFNRTHELTKVWWGQTCVSSPPERESVCRQLWEPLFPKETKADTSGYKFNWCVILSCIFFILFHYR